MASVIRAAADWRALGGQDADRSYENRGTF